MKAVSEIKAAYRFAVRAMRFSSGGHFFDAPDFLLELLLKLAVRYYPPLDSWWDEWQGINAMTREDWEPPALSLHGTAFIWRRRVSFDKRIKPSTSGSMAARLCEGPASLVCRSQNVGWKWETTYLHGQPIELKYSASSKKAMRLVQCKSAWCRPTFKVAQNGWEHKAGLISIDF